MNGDGKAPSSACPVDHETRAAWRKQPSTAFASPSSKSDPCNTSSADQASAAAAASSATTSTLDANRLDTARVTSSIPRAPMMTEETAADAPANGERTTKPSDSGKLIYPSEQMFFDDMRRKQYDTRREDMKTIVPIHNAVNERAWKEIQAWERGQGAER